MGVTSNLYTCLVAWYNRTSTQGVNTWLPIVLVKVGTLVIGIWNALLPVSISKVQGNLASAEIMGGILNLH